MSPPPPRPSRFQVSLAQIALIVAFTAVYFGALRWEIGHGRPGTSSVRTLFFLLLFSPSYWAVALVAIMRHSPIRAWLVRFLLVVQILPAVLLLALFTLVAAASHRDPFLGMGAGLLSAGAFLLCGLVGRLFPRRCPSCKRVRMIRDRAREIVSGRRCGPIFWCLRCGSSFEWHRLTSSWEPLPERGGKLLPRPASPHPLDHPEGPAGTMP